MYRNVVIMNKCREGHGLNYCYCYVTVLRRFMYITLVIIIRSSGEGPILNCSYSEVNIL
jgi:hypothetical protein